MISRVLLWLAVPIVCCCIASSAQAALEVRDWSNPGDGLLTYDPDTNLEWLDWTVTIGLSYDQILAELGVGGDYASFSQASPSDVLTLFQDAGIPKPDTFSFPAENYLPARALQEKIGITHTGWKTDASGGYTSHLGYYGYLEVRHFSGGSAAAVADVGPYSGTNIGHALARQAAVIPEPSTLIVWSLLGALGITVGWWRRKRVAA